MTTFAAVLTFPCYGSRDEFTGNRLRVLSTHETEEAAQAALSAAFPAPEEDDGGGDLGYSGHVAKAETPWVPIASNASAAWPIETDFF